MPERITILGDGAMATVCSILLTAGGHEVLIWGAFEHSIEALLQGRENPKLLPGVKVPPSVRLTANDGECFDGATVVVCAIPTQYIRGVFERLRRHVPNGVPIVSVAKGIETTSLLRPTQVINDALYPGTSAGPALCALSGPNVAGELARYLPATAVAASEDAALAQRVQGVFSTQWFRVYTNDDVVGV
ncbi:MAG TPA: NAD(P)-binding domain-containing protein, partial [Tepidisphaeraceae bacterium]